MNKQKVFSKYRLWCHKPNPTPVETLVDSKELETPKPVVVPTRRSVSAPVTPVGSPKHHDDYNQFDFAGQSQNNFLSLFGLVTQETGDVMKKQSNKRKKRSCASPHFLSLILQKEMQDIDGNVIEDVKPRKKKPGESNKRKEKITSSPIEVSTKIESNLKVAPVQLSSNQNDIMDYHDEICHVCSNVGELLLCDTCPYVYHVHCAELQDVPQGKWFCKVCQDKLPANFEVPYVTEETISLQYKALQEQRHTLLKQAYQIRNEKVQLIKAVNELTIVLESKNEVERIQLDKIHNIELLSRNIDDFLTSL